MIHINIKFYLPCKITEVNIFRFVYASFFTLGTLVCMWHPSIAPIQHIANRKKIKRIRSHFSKVYLSKLNDIGAFLQLLFFL